MYTGTQVHRYTKVIPRDSSKVNVGHAVHTAGALWVQIVVFSS